MTPAQQTVVCDDDDGPTVMEAMAVAAAAAAGVVMGVAMRVALLCTHIITIQFCARQGGRR